MAAAVTRDHPGAYEVGESAAGSSGADAYLDVTTDVTNTREASPADALGRLQSQCKLLVAHEPREATCPAGSIK